jgi:hypothetical protein
MSGTGLCVPGPEVLRQQAGTAAPMPMLDAAGQATTLHL